MIVTKNSFEFFFPCAPITSSNSLLFLISVFLIIVDDVKEVSEVHLARLDAEKSQLYVVGTHAAVRSAKLILDTQVSIPFILQFILEGIF